MPNYLVSYDLNAPGQNYDKLIKHLESYPTHWHFQMSAWIVGPADDALTVATAAWKHMDGNDKLVVQAFTPDSAWAGYDDEGISWLGEAIE